MKNILIYERLKYFNAFTKWMKISILKGLNHERAALVNNAYAKDSHKRSEFCALIWKSQFFHDKDS